MGRLNLLFDLPAGAAAVDRYTFSPGEPVKGRASLTVDVQEAIDHVKIVFKGKVYTLITRQAGQSRSRDSEEVTLFREQTTLFRGPFKAQPQTFEWPFSFTFPTSVTHNRGAHSGDKFFLGPGPAAPPPSFELNAASFTGRGEAQVSYVVKLQVNEGSLTRSNEVRQTLYCCPNVVGVLPQPELKLVRFPHARWESRSLRPEKHSFKQKITHVFSSDPNLRTPSLGFKLEMGVPERLGAEQHVSLPMAITYDKNGPTDPEAPSFVLSYVDMILNGNVAIRARTMFTDVDRTYETDDGRVRYDSLEVPLPLDGSPVQAVADFSLSSFPQFAHIRPAFRTWTIVHANTLQVVVGVRHVESGHVFTVKKKNISFTYLPPHIAVDGLLEDATAPPPLYPASGQGRSSTGAPPVYSNGGESSSAPPEYDYDETTFTQGDGKQNSQT